MTPKEYLARERAAETKSEYVNGEMYAMAGTSADHARIVSTLDILLNQALAPIGCEAVTADLRVKISTSGMYTYPDVVVLCRDSEFEDEAVDTLLNPQILVEVLSPSTENYDRGAKWKHYRGIPSLRHYLLVAQEEMLIEHYSRQTDSLWKFETFSQSADQITLDPPGITLRVADVYRRITFSAD